MMMMMMMMMSVCPSVTRRYCVQSITHSQSFLSSGSPTILVIFRIKRDDNIPTGIPLTGASNARRYEKITIFDQYLALYRK